MTHDSRRYHRTRRPTFTRGYGMLGDLGALAGTVGSGIESAAGAVGSGLESAASSVGTGLESAFTGGGTAAGGTPGIGAVAEKILGGSASPVQGAYQGLASIGHGLQSLFTGSGGEAGKLTALGQSVPAGVDLVGPSSTFAGPGFLSSVYQGFVNPTTFAKQFANPSAGTSAGAGVGQLLDAIQKLQQPGGMPATMPPVIQTGGPIRPMQVIPPANTGTVGPGPILGGLLGHL